jgi:hypothetical protein
MPDKKKYFLVGALLLPLYVLMANGDENMDKKNAVKDLPEHEVRPLPKDTFRPSEKVSEDFPVNFPVDI